MIGIAVLDMLEPEARHIVTADVSGVMYSWSLPGESCEVSQLLLLRCYRCIAGRAHHVRFDDEKVLIAWTLHKLLLA